MYLISMVKSVSPPTTILPLNIYLNDSSAGSVFGRILPGYIADKVGYFNTMTEVSFLSAISILYL